MACWRHGTREAGEMPVVCYADKPSRRHADKPSPSPTITPFLTPSLPPSLPLSLSCICVRVFSFPLSHPRYFPSFSLPPFPRPNAAASCSPPSAASGPQSPVAAAAAYFRVIPVYTSVCSNVASLGFGFAPSLPGCCCGRVRIFGPPLRPADLARLAAAGLTTPAGVRYGPVVLRPLPSRCGATAPSHPRRPRRCVTVGEQREGEGQKGREVTIGAGKEEGFGGRGSAERDCDGFGCEVVTVAGERACGVFG